MRQRLAIAAFLTLLAGCDTRVDTDARSVFVHALGDEPPFLQVVHGYRYSRHALGFTRDEVVLLHMRSGGANQALWSRWPDLEETSTPPAEMAASLTNPWFMPPEHSYLYWKSRGDPNVTVAQEFPSLDIYVRYID